MKIFIRSAFILLLVLITIKIAYAASMGKLFGGRIIKTTSIKITAVESLGYTCMVPGETLDIKSVKGPISYFYSVKPVTKTTPKSGQQILGKYSGQTTITCTKPCPPPPGNECTQTVTLDTITYFGTSKR